jgi:hypothetical protein
VSLIDTLLFYLIIRYTLNVDKDDESNVYDSLKIIKYKIDNSEFDINLLKEEGLL